jgi:hypothetical protein
MELFNEATVGQSGVRALPLAAGINEGGYRYSKPQKGLL